MTIKKPRTILCFFAHPDDESFGPGGAIASWILQGATAHIICATKGDVGGKPTIRAKELKNASRILGVKSVTFLKYKDGKIGNNDLALLEKEFIALIEKYKPDTILTYDLNGISGHIDHIAVASAATQAFRKTTHPTQLLYHVTQKALSDFMGAYFIFFPEGKTREQADLIIDITKVWEQKVQAMKQHVSQMHDVEQILAKRIHFPKEEWFVVRTAK